uniref:SNW domain-containing protein 1 n=1 Tax=Hucho hucho TaxID=62062 RepID=A0A4W5P4J1_9TELE
MSLTSFLPAPTQLSQDQLESEERVRAQRSHSTALVSSRREPPPPYGCRKSWVPRSLEDFGDGGAFPEIHVAQFPLEMGRKKKTSNALAVQVDAEGKIKYDAIARQDRVIFSKYSDLLPKEEAVKELTEKTRDALMKQVSQKIAAAMPVRAADKQAPAQYIRYTPSQQGVAFNSGAKQRVIRMVEMQKDPMEPPRFKINKKIPRGPPSPPAPVMHSPSRKVPVGKVYPKLSPVFRLAADGRGLQIVHINENFAKLAEALYIADRKAREAVEMRAQVEKKMAQKEEKEKLRELAQMARDRRAGIKGHGGDKGGEDGEARERDEIRHDRRKERQHDRNISRAAPDKRSKLQRDQDRDVSELIALGQPNPRASSEAQYDQRLFNQTKVTHTHTHTPAVGFAGGEDGMYNVYDQPFRSGRDMAQNIYRPTKSSEKDMYRDDLDTLMQSNRFVPDREFSGTDHGRRDCPVQFEWDPFGLDKFLEEAKQHGGSKRPSTSRGSKDYDHDKKRRKE